MLKRTEGIVLRNRPYLEADLIVTYLTKDFGVIDLFAKSPRKVGSRFGSSLEPLTYAKISLYGKEQSNLPRLTQSDIIRPFHGLRESIQTFLRVSEILELTLKVLPVHEANRQVFALLLNTLELLEEKYEPLYITFYKIKLLLMTGFAPQLHRCLRCGGSTERFYLSEGAALCSNCADGNNKYILFDQPVRRLYNYLVRIRPTVLKRLRISRELLSGLEELIDSHINYTVVDRMNTKEFVLQAEGRG